MRLNKRACRKLADPTWKMNLNSGLFCADQLQYIVRSAVRNVDHQRVLILYVYDREQVNVGETRPLWTVFQSREQYITLARREDGAVYWRKAAFDNLSRQPSFRNKCAFYSLNDEKKVMRFCKEDKKDGFACLDSLQSRIMHQSTLQRRHSKQRKIIERMETVPGLPRGLKSWIHKEIMPVYIFYTYSKGAKEMVGYCTACRRSVKVSGIKHNTDGCCPLCKKAVTYKSRGRRGNVLDRETLQVLQRISDTELVVRFVKIYRRYPNADVPEEDIYESSRIFICLDRKGAASSEHFYKQFYSEDITPWKKGNRPVFSKWQYNFNADDNGYLYDRNLDLVLDNTPWKYSQLKNYYQADKSPFYVIDYLKRFLDYPMLEYLVKLGLYRLAEELVNPNYYYYMLDYAINKKGKSIYGVLGLGKSYLPLLRRINPGSKQLTLIKKFLKNHIPVDEQLFTWCTRHKVGRLENLTVPLQYMTAYKLIRYANEQFEKYQRRSWSDQTVFYDMETLLNSYRDYISMCEALEYDLSNSFVLYPANLSKAHDKVNDLSDKEKAQAYENQIQKLYEKLNSQYTFMQNGYFIVLPRSVKEIMEEGHKLHHCIGTYVKSIVKRKCLVFFVRKVSEPDKPLCTVELNGAEVGQVSMFGNKAPTPQIKLFLKVWEQKVVMAPAEQLAA